MRQDKKKENDIINILSHTMLFKDIPVETISLLVSSYAGRLKKYKKKELLIRTGEPVDFIGIVMKGTVLVNRLMKDGQEVTVHVLKERKTIGIEYASKSRGKSIFDYIAVTDVEMYLIRRKDLLDKDLLGTNTVNQLLVNLMELMQHENLRQHQKLYILSMGTLRKKLQMFLYYEYKKTNSTEFDISFNRETLAAYLCVNRSALSREISCMEKEGLIETKNKHFVIRDLKIIEEMGNGHEK